MMQNPGPKCIEMGLNPDLFYPERGENIHPNVRIACGTCPVQAECLDWALDNNEWGHWGNVSERKRKQMRRKLKEARR